MASLVLPFESPEVADGKGTNLSRLVRAGFRWPATKVFVRQGNPTCRIAG